MASDVYHSIVIQTANQYGDVTRKESLAAAAITPGELLDFDSATTVNAHGVAAGFLQGKLVALETQTPDDEDNPPLTWTMRQVILYTMPKASRVMFSICGWLLVRLP